MKTQSFELVQRLGKDSKAFGLIVDQGESFSKEYGSEGFHDSDGLRKVIDPVDDIMKLGSAIHNSLQEYFYYN